MLRRIGDTWRGWARTLKRHALTVYFIARNPRTPAAVRLLAFLTAAYALSPIDLIPDFVPVLGYLDDLIIVPIGLALALRLTPPDIIRDAGEKAALLSRRPVSIMAAVIILAFWLCLAVALIHWGFNNRAGD